MQAPCTRRTGAKRGDSRRVDQLGNICRIAEPAGEKVLALREVRSRPRRVKNDAHARGHEADGFGQGLWHGGSMLLAGKLLYSNGSFRI